jgi:hypothetical protein
MYKTPAIFSSVCIYSSPVLAVEYSFYVNLTCDVYAT